MFVPVRCAYLSRILETVTLRMRSESLYQLRSHNTPFSEIRVMFMFVPVRCAYLSRILETHFTHAQ